MAKVWHQKFRLVLVAIFFIAVSVWLMLKNETKDATNVVGVVESHQASLHEAGHTLHLMVRLTDREKLVRVKLPQREPIKKGDKVELRRLGRALSGTERHLFLKYVDEPKI
ncbi:hypothetical protein [Enterovibrio calviensis]|uniref:hypothetical protein n=1 Tax=Enterovibrio calviensis TaxID=91359 RepID=UPI000483783C|nr:hypothetical protein [Enterovibrio calviensis]